MNFKKRFEDPLVYADYEYKLAKCIIIPELRKTGITIKGKKMLDAGCGWGGCSVAFAEAKAKCTGIDLGVHQIRYAREFAKLKKSNVKFLIDNVCNLKIKDKFDIIIFRDAIEYMDDSSKSISSIKRILMPKGLLYVTFSPWYGPYGGHQHHPDSITRFIPYIHLLPKRVFFWALKNKKGLMIKNKPYLEEISKISNNRLSISKFEKIVKEAGLKIYKKRLYISRPTFKVKYGIPAINSGIFGKMPLIKEFFITGAEYILTK